MSGCCTIVGRCNHLLSHCPRGESDQRRESALHRLCAVGQGALKRAPVVAIKMDVEGHEYKILRHVWERSPSALCKLSIMAIEWHERMMESDQGGAQEWTKRLQSCNTPVIHWA